MPEGEGPIPTSEQQAKDRVDSTPIEQDRKLEEETETESNAEDSEAPDSDSRRGNGSGSDAAPAAEVDHISLLLNPEMLDYVTGRGITLDTIKLFRLGDTTGDNLEKYFRFRGWGLELGRELGPTGERGEFFRKRIITPAWRNGNAMYLVGRQTQKCQRAKYPGLPGAPKPRHELKAAQKHRGVFIAECAFNMLTLLQWGYPAIALLGSHLKREWMEELSSSERIYVVTDSDAAGRASALRLTASVQSSFLHFPMQRTSTN